MHTLHARLIPELNTQHAPEHGGVHVGRAFQVPPQDLLGMSKIAQQHPTTPPAGATTQLPIVNQLDLPESGEANFDFLLMPTRDDVVPRPTIQLASVF